MEISTPGAAEILRASQRDSDFIKKLSEELTQLIQTAFGQRHWLKWRRWTDFYIPASLYYLLTNLSGNQTLGEEHAGILQVDSSHRKIPSKMTLTAMLALQVFGRPLLEHSITKLKLFLEKKRSQLSEQHQSNMKSAVSGTFRFASPFSDLQIYNLIRNTNWSHLCLTSMLKFLNIFQKCLPFLTQFHLVLFFFHKKFYDFSKRVMGIHYILLRKYFANVNPASLQNLRYLMWMSLINLFLTGTQSLVNFVKSYKNSTMIEKPIQTSAQKEEVRSRSSKQIEEPSSSSRKCSLCLEVRVHPSVTPCGHLFCWHCIIEWLSSKQECPICREHVLPSRVIPLQNYS